MGFDEVNHSGFHAVRLQRAFCYSFVQQFNPRALEMVSQSLPQIIAPGQTSATPSQPSHRMVRYA